MCYMVSALNHWSKQQIGEDRVQKTGQMELVRFILEGLQLLVFSLVTHFSTKEWGRYETYACLR